MRLKQLERTENISEHYKSYKAGKQWYLALILAVGGVMLGTQTFVNPIHADTTSAATTAPLVASTAPTSASAATLTTTTSAAVTAASSAATSSAATSVATVSATSSPLTESSAASTATSLVSAAPSTASVASSSASITAASSSAPLTESSAASTASSLINDSSSAASSTTSTATSAASSATSTAPATSSTATSAASSAASTAPVTSSTAISAASSAASTAPATSSTATSTASSAASTAPATSSTATSAASSAASTASATSSTATSAISSAASTAPATSSTATSAASSAASTAPATSSSAATSTAANDTATTAPQVIVQFLSTATGKAIKPAVTLTGAKVGDPYDLTGDTSLAEYTFDATVSGPVTGTYTTQPQTIKLCFTPEPIAGTVTVYYLDQDGQSILPATTIKGQVGDHYSITPAPIEYYTYTNLGSGSLPLSGQLTAQAGNILLAYQGSYAKAIVKIVDGTTNQVLETNTLSGIMGTISPYSAADSIAFYESQGYQLANDNVPAAGVSFLRPDYTPTYTVTLTHNLTTITPTSPLDPAQLADLDLTKMVTQTINYVDANGDVLAPATTSSVTFNRDITLDDVTGIATYSAWTPTTTPSFATVTAPTVSGYTPEEATVAASAVTPTSADQTAEIVYDADVTPTEPVVTTPTSSAATSTTAPTQPTVTPTTTPKATTTSTPTTTAKVTPTVTKPESTTKKTMTKAAPTIKTMTEKKTSTKPTTLATTKVATKPTTKSVAMAKITPTAKTIRLTRPTTTPTVAQPIATKSTAVYNDRGQLIGTSRTPMAKTVAEKRLSPARHDHERPLATGLPQTSEANPKSTGFFGLLMLGLSSLLGMLGLGRRQRHNN